MKKILIFVMCMFSFSLILNAKDYKDDELYFSIPDNWKETVSTSDKGTIKYSFTDYGQNTLQQITITKESIAECDKFIFSNGAVRDKYNLSSDVSIEQEIINGVFFEKFTYEMPVGTTKFNSINYVSANECSIYRFEYSYVDQNIMEDEFYDIVESFKFKRNQIPINNTTVAIVNAARIGFALIGIIIIIIVIMYAKNYFQAQKQKNKVQ